MNEYRLNDCLNHVQAYHFTGTRWDFEQMVKFLKDSDISKYISTIEPLERNPVNNDIDGTYGKTADDITAVIMWRTSIGSNNFYATKVYPKNVLVVKVQPCDDGKDLAMIFSLEKKIFDMFYKSAN